MVDEWMRQTLEGWVSDFCVSDAYRGLSQPGQEYASTILPVFLEAACDATGEAPGELSEAACRAGLLDGVAGLSLPQSAHKAAPDACAALLGELQAQGRLAGGAALGKFVRALRQAYGEKTADTVKPIVGPSHRVGRNDPCPCGSGKKFKKCCMIST